MSSRGAPSDRRARGNCPRCPPLIWSCLGPLQKGINNGNISRRDFSRTLTEELAGPQVQKRNHIPGQASFTNNNDNEKEPKNFVK